jgi:hypothetical protein
MSNAIQQVFNSMDLRRKIFNFKTDEKMIGMFYSNQYNRHKITLELNMYIKILKYEFENYEYPLEFTQENFVNEFFEWVSNDILEEDLKYIREY